MFDFIVDGYLSKYIISPELIILLLATVLAIFSFFPRARKFIGAIICTSFGIFVSLMLNHYGYITINPVALDFYHKAINFGLQALEGITVIYTQIASVSVFADIHNLLANILSSFNVVVLAFYFVFLGFYISVALTAINLTETEEETIVTYTNTTKEIIINKPVLLKTVKMNC